MPLASIIVSQTWKLRCTSNVPVLPGPGYSIYFKNENFKIKKHGTWAIRYYLLQQWKVAIYLNKMMGLLILCPNWQGKFQNYMSEFEYWALTIKVSPQTCKEESQYPQLVAWPMIDYNRKSVDYSRISINWARTYKSVNRRKSKIHEFVSFIAFLGF